MVSRAHNFIFVHIPKTGGNALQHALLGCADDTVKIGARNFHDGVERFGLTLAGTTLNKHSTISDYATQLEPGFFDQARRFTIVRNPWGPCDLVLLLSSQGTAAQTGRPADD